MAAANATRRGMGIAGAMVFAAALTLVFVGCFAAWAAWAPLDSAALASGSLVVESRRKTVQHLEGGIIAEIFVREGDEVEIGQPLLRLDDTRTRTTLATLRAQLATSLAVAARLAAERDNAETIAFPPELDALDRDDIRLGQTRLFEARRATRSGQSAILRQRVAQLEEEIGGLNAQIRAEGRQLDLIEREIAGVKQLVETGLERLPRLLALQRQQAEIDGSRARNLASVARARQSIGEAQLRIIEIATEFQNEVLKQLQDLTPQIAELREKLVSAEDAVARSIVRSPVAGRVVNLQVATLGGVVRPGEALLDVVPGGDRLVVDARIDANDIDVVRPGLPAQIRLTPFNQRAMPSLDGNVLHVSADRLTDDRTGLPYYTARIAFAESDPALQGLALYPGMPAEITIVTGKGSVGDYLLKPLLRGLDRAFREDQT